MILESIRIENFRSFKDETISFDRLTSLLGPNGSGKSTVLTALNVFFRNTATTSTNVVSLTREDFHHCDTSQPVRITLTFSDLSDEAKDDLKYYVRHDHLVVSAKATWNSATNTAEVQQFGSRMVIKAFAPFFEAKERKEPAQNLTAAYDELKRQFPDLPSAKSAEARAEALRSYEEAHPEECELLEATAQFFGFTRGANLLAKYIQWVYIPAVKDASSEQEEGGKTALGQLLERTVRQKVDFKTPIAEMKHKLEEDYKTVVASQQGALGELEHTITQRLRQWSTPAANLKLSWHFDPNKTLVVNEPIARASIGEGSFVGEVSRLGHGLQRAFLVSVLHELASTGGASGPTLLLGFEEPELYQHPPQAQYMASVLEDLATPANNSQVIISTHSPYFVSSSGFERVRMIRKHSGQHRSAVAHTTFQKVDERVSRALDKDVGRPSEMLASLEQIMQPTQRELFFSRVAILVEGIEDIAFIGAHLHITKRWADFRARGCHFVVAAGKTNISRLLAIAQELKIPAFVVFDADSDDDKNREKTNRDNACLFRLCGLKEPPTEFPEVLWGNNYVVWPTNIAGAVRADLTADVWGKAEQEVRKAKGFDSVKQKNNLLIAGVMEHLASQGIKSPLLEKLSARMLEYAGRDHC